MNTYRLYTLEPDQETTIDGIKVTNEPLFIHTKKTLDVHALWEQGVAAKEYDIDALPNHIDITDLTSHEHGGDD